MDINPYKAPETHSSAVFSMATHESPWRAALGGALRGGLLLGGAFMAIYIGGLLGHRLANLAMPESTAAMLAGAALVSLAGALLGAIVGGILGALFRTIVNALFAAPRGEALDAGARRSP